MNRDDVLAKAGELINGQRHQDYGDASKNFDDIAKLWSPILGIEVEPWRVALCMTQLKIARIFKTPTHEDSWADGVGYLALGSELATTADEPDVEQLELRDCNGVVIRTSHTGTRFQVGDEVRGDDYLMLPAGTTVDDPTDSAEGLLVRQEDGRWAEVDGHVWEASPCLPRTIVSLPEPRQ